MGTAMFNAEYQDPSYVRQFLSQWMHRDSGTGAMPDFPARLQMNGEFWQLAFFNLPASESLLDVMGYDPNGAMYKFVYQVEPIGSPEKRTRKWEGNADYTALANAITRAKSADAQRAAAVYDMLDLPQVINYIAIARIVMECDDVWANMTLYRDSDGDGLWRIIPYDLNLSFGQMYAGEYRVLTAASTPTTTISRPIRFTAAASIRFLIPQRLFFDYNQIYDAIMMDPTTREMLLAPHAFADGRVFACRRELRTPTAPSKTCSTIWWLESRLKRIWIKLNGVGRRKAGRTAWARPRSHRQSATLKHSI